MTKENSDPSQQNYSEMRPYSENAAGLPVHNLDEFDIIQDSENNNVDENSNDHQYNEFRDYHNHRHHPFPTQEQSVRPRVYSNSSVNVGQQSVQNDTSVRPRNILRTYEDDTDRSPVVPRNIVHQSSSDFMATNSSTQDFSSLERLPAGPPRDDDKQINSTEEAQYLINNFAREAISANTEVASNVLDIIPFREPNNAALLTTGRNLRCMADRFAESDERRKIKRMVKDLDFNTLTEANFFAMCGVLFQDGQITSERIVALFTFIADVAVEVVNSMGCSEFLRTMLGWALSYIIKHISKWVQNCGGWGAVFNHGANFVFWTAVTISLGVFSFAGILYIMDKLKKG